MSSQKNAFLIFLLLPGFAILRGREGIITLFCRGEHQESGVKIITSFHLRLIFFLAFSFFSFSFVIILKICVKIYLELTLNPTVTNADQKVVFNTWSIFWDLKAYRAQSAGKQFN